MTLGPRFQGALTLAYDLHSEQVRKDSEIPYMSHILGVAGLVLDYGGTEAQAIAGLLHDAAEDQGGKETLDMIRDAFGDEVATIVTCATDTVESPKPPWRQRKKAFIANLPEFPAEAHLVISADKLHNLRTIVMDYRDVGETLWDRFRGGREGTLWYYRSITETLEQCFDHAISRELSNTWKIASELAGDGGKGS